MRFSQRLPRTRGDGPLSEGLAASSCRWGGSPAHAGMDPMHGRSASTGQRGGSPAHAGMDPDAIQARSSLVSDGLPRTRGDGPVQRRVIPGQNSTRRLPRTRGDRPVTPSPGGHQQAAPPHTRGWTRFAQTWRLPKPVGSPAHAGMDPRTSQLAYENSFVGSPAHAGMDPRTLTRCETDAVEGSPAHAGMDPSWAADARPDPSRLPRTRGDGPITFKAIGDDVAMFGLPRTRGDGPAASDFV